MTYYIMPKHVPCKNGMYLFSKNAHIERACEMRIQLFAAMRYILYVNGEYICEGPCRSHEKVRYYDEVCVPFRAGENLIEVKVMHTADFFTTVYKTVVPMLVFEANSELGDSIISDESWDCRFLGEYKLVCHGMNSLAPFEIVTKGEKDISLPLERADKCIFKEDGYFICGGASLNFLLEKRPIPMIYPGDKVVLSPFRSGQNFSEYDAGEYMTAKLAFYIAPHSKVRIIYAECFLNADGTKGKRDDRSGVLQGYFDEVETGNEAFLFEPFWFRSFRYIRIEGEGVTAVFARRMHYPYEIQGRFECSDALYNKMHEISVNTILCCSHEIMSDCPYYEQQQYQMDSDVQAAATYAMSSDARLIRKALSEFASSNQPSGLQLSICPQSWAVQIIPGFSFFFVRMLRSYLESTRDLSFVSRCISSMDAILGYFAREFKEKGFLTKTRYWDFIDWVPSWEHRGGGTVPLLDGEAHTLYNLYFICALNDAAFIAEKCGRSGLSEEYRMLSEEVSRVVNALCFDPEKKMYKDGSETKTYSMHTSIFAILAGIADAARTDALVDLLDVEDVTKCTFVMNYYLLRALEKCGRYDRAARVFLGWRPMVENGCTTWCETPVNSRSECHGFSAAPLCDFSRNILGVRIGYEDEIFIKPSILHLSYAKGVVPSRFGNVSVDWHIEDRTFRITVKSGDMIPKRLVLPDGTEHHFDAPYASFSCQIENIK